MRTLNHATATSLSAFAAAVLAVGSSAIAAERFSVRRIAVWLERKSRDDDSYELLQQVAATLEREALEWVTEGGTATARVSETFAAVGHVLPKLDPPARHLIDANLDLERMADIVVECAQSQAPSDFDNDEVDVLTETTSGATANALVFRVLILRTFELILADPAYERVLRMAFEPGRTASPLPDAIEEPEVHVAADAAPVDLPDAAQDLAAVTTVAGTIRPELAAPPSEAEAPQSSDRSSIRSLFRWPIVILIVGVAALAVWIYREEVGAVVAELLDLFRSTH